MLNLLYCDHSYSHKNNPKHVTIALALLMSNYAQTLRTENKGDITINIFYNSHPINNNNNNNYYLFLPTKEFTILVVTNHVIKDINNSQN